MITTHVLDIAKGRPAPALPVTLEHRSEGGDWSLIAQGITDDDGRWPVSQEPRPGSYRLTFRTADYLGPGHFYSAIQIAFEVYDPAQHYHVPLLLSPYGYSTYRGS